MDNVTHTLFALTLARTPLGRGRGATAALVLASNAPDVDIVATLGGTANYLKWHRGPTHGPLGVIGLGFATALIVWVYGRFFAERFLPGSWVPPSGGTIRLKPDPTATSFASLLTASMVGVLFHILMDLPTSYGTRLLSPFTWRWYAIDLLPIIDIYLVVALAAGLALGRGSAAAGRRCAAIVFAFMAVNYGGRAVAHHQALALTSKRFAAALPPACDQHASRSAIDAWPSPEVSHAGSAPCAADVAALPTFLSPFEWRIVSRLPGRYWVYDADILDRRRSTSPASADRSVSIPNQWTPAVVEAAKGRAGQLFLGFSRFPDAQASVDAAHQTIVRFTDVRFAVIERDPGVRRPAPFTLTVRLGAKHEILQERLGP